MPGSTGSPRLPLPQPLSAMLSRSLCPGNTEAYPDLDSLSLLTLPLSRTLPAFLTSHLLPPSHLCFPPTSVAQCSPRFPRAGRYNLRLRFHQETPDHAVCSRPALLSQPLQPTARSAAIPAAHPASCPSPNCRRKDSNSTLSSCMSCCPAADRASRRHSLSLTAAHVAATTAPNPVTSSPHPKRRARLSFSFPSSFTSAVKPRLLVTLLYERLGQPSRMALTPSAPERKKSPPPTTTFSPHLPQGHFMKWVTRPLPTAVPEPGATPSPDGDNQPGGLQRARELQIRIFAHLLHSEEAESGTPSTKAMKGRFETRQQSNPPCKKARGKCVYVKYGRGGGFLQELLKPPSLFPKHLCSLPSTRSLPGKAACCASLDAARSKEQTNRLSSQHSGAHCLQLLSKQTIVLFPLRAKTGPGSLPPSGRCFHTCSRGAPPKSRPRPSLLFPHPEPPPTPEPLNPDVVRGGRGREGRPAEAHLERARPPGCKLR